MSETMSQSKPELRLSGMRSQNAKVMSTVPILAALSRDFHGFSKLWVEPQPWCQGRERGVQELSSSSMYLWGLEAQWRAPLSLLSWEQTSSCPLSSKSVQKKEHVCHSHVEFSCLQGQGGPSLFPHKWCVGGGADRWGCALSMRFWGYCQENGYLGFSSPCGGSACNNCSLALLSSPVF